MPSYVGEEVMWKPPRLYIIFQQCSTQSHVGSRTTQTTSAEMRNDRALEADITGLPCGWKEAPGISGKWEGRLLSFIHVSSTPSKMKESSLVKTMHGLVRRCPLLARVCSRLASPVCCYQIVLLQRTGSTIQNKMKDNCFWRKNILIETYSY